MSDLPDDRCHRRAGTLQGAFAYGLVVLTCYAGFFSRQSYQTGAWAVPVVFTLGAVYVALGVLSGSYSAGRLGPKWRGYFPVQIAIVTAIMLLSPTRGFMAIVVLPVLAQGIFELRAWQSTLIGFYLFGLSLMAIALPFGWLAAWQTALSYATAFIFTVAFSLLTKQALLAREREEKLRREVEAANRQLRAHAAQAEELATTRERNRLAREIHDGVGHYLTVIKTQLDAATALLASDPERARATVVKAAKLAGDALDDVRRSVGSLRTDIARPALADALKALTHEANLPVTIRVEGDARPLPAAVEHALFRSAQEGLTNIRKHAGATAAEVVLRFKDTGEVTLTVIDNGKGVAHGVSGGFGLRGITERVEILGGRVQSGNRRDGGFALTIELPA